MSADFAGFEHDYRSVNLKRPSAYLEANPLALASEVKSLALAMASEVNP